MNALVLRHADAAAEGRARKLGYTLSVSDGWALSAERTLFVAAGTAIPYNLLEPGFGFLERWDVAAPLWRYGVLAADVGGPTERTRTEAVVKDLRQLLYAHELLFVRDSVDGRRFLETWLAECEGKAEPRLAFLRALHMVKPLFCALPRSWLAEEALRVRQDARVAIPRVQPHGETPRGLVRVEIGPGRFVTCHPGEEARVKALFSEQTLSRSERRQLNAH